MHINKKAFSLIELSIVLLIIGVIIAGITQSSRLISAFRLSSARTQTKSAPVASIRDLVLWLDASAENAFATGSSGTYVNYSELDDATKIARWNDINPQSSTKNDAVQSTSANQPTYKISAFNNLPSLLFASATSTRIFSPLSIDYVANPNITMFLVFRSSSSADQFLLGNNAGNWGRFIAPNNAGATGGAVSSGSGFTVVPTLNSPNTSMVFTLIMQNSVTNGSSAYINGVNKVTFTENQGSSQELVLTIGAISTTTVTEFYQGLISEIVIYYRVLKVEERQAVERYLGKKWGISVS